MNSPYSAPTFAANTPWTRVVLSDQHVREETLRGLARAWVEDPAAVAEHLGLLAEADGHADQFSDACINAEVDLHLDPAEVELRLADARPLLRQLIGAMTKVRKTQPRWLTAVPTQQHREAS